MNSGVALERGHDHVAHLARFGRALGDLQIVLDLGRLVAGGHAAVDPLRALHELAAARDLRLGQDPGQCAASMAAQNLQVPVNRKVRAVARDDVARVDGVEVAGRPRR